METLAGLTEAVAHCHFSWEEKTLLFELKIYVCVFSFFCSLMFSPFSSFFLVEALYPLSSKAKLESHETISVTTLGKDTNENRNSLAPILFIFVHIPSVWDGGKGEGLPVVILLGEVCSFSRKRIFGLKMASGRVGGWERNKLLAFFTYSYIFCSSSASINLIQVCFPLKSVLLASIECLLCAIVVILREGI